jgi:hypothetical protein
VAPVATTHARVDEPQLLVEPPPVMPHLARDWLLMDAPLTPLLEFEVLDRIGDVEALSSPPPGTRSTGWRRIGWRTSKSSRMRRFVTC